MIPYKLQLKKLAAVITNAKPGKENHGDDLVPSLDVRFSVHATSDLLAQIVGDSKPLIAALWNKDNDLALPIDHLAIETKFVDHTVTINIGKGNDVVLKSCKICDFNVKFGIQKVVDLAFRVRASHVTAKQIGAASISIEQGVKITTEPEQADIEDKKKADVADIKAP